MGLLNDVKGTKVEDKAPVVAKADKAEKKAVTKKCDEEAAFFYKDTVEQKMQNLRKVVDEMETLTAREVWPMPTYGDITFRV
jgi:glutamine synthetase